ncbi:hypothetical protein [Nocardioides sp.]|uniref:hypothetical protein n=1 Tax=Nocardioides sp. TaxID=35761 RepID=UPI001A1873A0|nr:hypothetical protein [Nocardioides sp.]MBJ7357526.1 hypothetical protein [Nocardioides sp.]
MRDRRERRARTRIGLIGLVAVVAGTLLPAGTAAAVESKPEWGSVSVENGVLKRSCRNYPYTYAVTVPEQGLWDLNVSLVGPGGRVVWFGYLTEGANPEQGTATFRLCRSKTKPGRYRLEAVVSVQDNNENTAGSLDPVSFRLRKPR